MCEERFWLSATPGHGASERGGAGLSRGRAWFILPLSERHPEARQGAGKVIPAFPGEKSESWSSIAACYEKGNS